MQVVCSFCLPSSLIALVRKYIRANVLRGMLKVITLAQHVACCQFRLCLRPSFLSEHRVSN